MLKDKMIKVKKWYRFTRFLDKTSQVTLWGLLAYGIVISILGLVDYWGANGGSIVVSIPLEFSVGLLTLLVLFTILRVSFRLSLHKYMSLEEEEQRKLVANFVENRKKKLEKEGETNAPLN